MSAQRATENPLAGAANLRGGLLIVVAVIVGVVLLGKGFDTGIIGSSGGDPSDEAATGGDDGSDEGGDSGTDGATTSTTAVAHIPAEVRVQVLNSSGPGGSAGNAIHPTVHGWLRRPGHDQRQRPAATASAVFAQPGYEADAAAIATALGLTVVRSPPTTSPRPARSRPTPRRASTSPSTASSGVTSTPTARAEATTRS